MASNNDNQQFTDALRSNLSSSNSPDVASAVSSFSQPITASVQNGAPSSEIEGQLWNAWGAAIEFAASTADSQQDSIAQTIKETGKLGTIKSNNGQTCEVQGGAIWTDLPIFGAAMREAWNPDPKDMASWRNKNAFAARLTQTGNGKSPLDFGLYGIWSNRSALESQAAANADWVSIQSTDIEASCMWFIYGAQILLQSSNKNKSFEGKVAKVGDGYPDKNWNGFCVDRWILWKENLQALHDSDSHSSSKDLIQSALEAIAYAEQN